MAIDKKIEKYLSEKAPTDPAAKHQIAIARKTLKMNDAMAKVMGGMTKDEARAILKKYGLKEATTPEGRARAQFQVLMNTVENIIDDATEKAEDQMMIAEEKIENIYKKAVKDAIKQFDDAGDAAEGAWSFSSSTVDKFFQRMYQNLVKEYVMKPKDRTSHPIVDAFWEAVSEEWIER